MPATRACCGRALIWRPLLGIYTQEFRSRPSVHGCRMKVTCCLSLAEVNGCDSLLLVAHNWRQSAFQRLAS